MDDFTIVAGNGREFFVHKSVLMRNSEYFRVLLESSRESQQARVQLNDVAADALADMLHYVYCGEFPEESVVAATELLQLAVKLQICNAIEAITEHLFHRKLTAKTCWTMLHLFKSYSLQPAVERLKQFIIENMVNVVRFPNVTSADLSDIEFLVDHWELAEFRLFDLLTRWIRADRADRHGLEERLLGQVRFGLLSPSELAEVMASPEYVKGSGKWKTMVHQADQYNALDHLAKKIDFYEGSDQNKMRGNPDSLVFYRCNLQDPNTPEIFHACDPKERQWHSHMFFMDEENASCASEVSHQVTHPFLAVNGFLLITTLVTTNNRTTDCAYAIFDVRTKRWQRMSSPGEMVMSSPAEMVTHKLAVYERGSLYFFKGEPNGMCNSVTCVKHTPQNYVCRYDLHSDSWHTVARNCLALCKDLTSACNVNGRVFISGRQSVNRETSCFHEPHTNEIDCYVLETGEWEMMGCVPEKAHREFKLHAWSETSVCYLSDQLNFVVYDLDTKTWDICFIPFTDNARKYLSSDTWVKVFVTQNVIYFYYRRKHAIYVYDRHGNEGMYTMSDEGKLDDETILTVLSIPKFI